MTLRCCPGTPSATLNVRPSKGAVRRTEKNSGETCIPCTAKGSLCALRFVINPEIAAIDSNACDCSRQSIKLKGFTTFLGESRREGDSHIVPRPPRPRGGHGLHRNPRTTLQHA